MKKNHILKYSILLLFLFFSCKKNDYINQRELRTHQNGRDALTYIKMIEKQKAQAVVSFVENLPIEEKVAQLFIVNISGNKQFKPVENQISGGYLYFAYNLADTPEQILNFNKSVYEYCKENNKIPPFLAIDQEGGLVNRLKKINGNLPSQKYVADNLDLSDAEKLYKLQGVQMKNLGFTMNLAPVVEICNDSNKDFIGDRSFGSIEKVLDYGKACISSYEQNGIGTVLKHFPGNSNSDPHIGLPVANWSKEELDLQLKPFIEFSKLKPSGILMSHIIINGLNEVPACLSEFWVTQKLRNEYHYEGIIFSDDIFMGALAKNGYDTKKAAVMAIEAGIDCIMLSDKYFNEPLSILCQKSLEDEDFLKKINQSCCRIINYKIKNGLMKIELQKNGEYKVITDIDLQHFGNIYEFDKAKDQNNQLFETTQK